MAGIIINIRGFIRLLESNLIYVKIQKCDEVGISLAILIRIIKGTLYYLVTGVIFVLN